MAERAERMQAAKASRRGFIKSSSAGLLAAGLAAQGVHAAGGETLRVGLVGCGGRGTGAALQALKADSQAKLVAMADVFDDRLNTSLEELKKSEVAERVVVDPEHRFLGFDAYEHVIAASDVVLLATPPHFRPAHLKAAIDAGKHVFAEKPVAVDAPGVREVLAACEEAKRKNLTVVSGLCWRYETGMRETVQRIQDGAIGDVVSLEATRNAGGMWVRPRKPGMTDMQYQLDNWFYYTWLSGDFICEQFVHELDKMAWVMGDVPPKLCYAVGGRQTRTGPEFGHIFDHFNMVFEYESGTRLYAGTRHQLGCSSVYVNHALGTKGSANMMKYNITGENPWKWRGRTTVMHQLEQDAMMAAIRNSRPINDGEFMAKSTLLAIMARMSAYTGKTITWDEALASSEKLGPERYDWNMELPEPPVATPGVTRFS